MKGKKLIFIITLLITGLLTVNVSALAITGREVMERADDRETGNTQHALMGMDLIDENGEVSPRTIEVWAIKYGDPEADLRKVVMEFKSPASVADTRFLQVENEDIDDDQWIYLPGLQRVRRISSSQGEDSFMGSDFSYDDMESRNIDEYNYELLREEKLNKYGCYVVKSIPKDPEDSNYKQSISWITKKHYIPVKVKMFSKDTGKLQKLMTVKQNIKKINGIWTVFSTTMKDLESGHSTELYVKQGNSSRYFIEYNKKISEARFTQRFLKKGN